MSNVVQIRLSMRLNSHRGQTCDFEARSQLGTGLFPVLSVLRYGGADASISSAMGPSKSSCGGSTKSGFTGIQLLKYDTGRSGFSEMPQIPVQSTYIMRSVFQLRFAPRTYFQRLQDHRLDDFRKQTASKCRVERHCGIAQYTSAKQNHRLVKLRHKYTP